MLTKNPAASSGGHARMGPSNEGVDACRGAPTIRAVPGRVSTLRVLVADDDRDTIDSLSLLVKRWGHDVWAALDGAEALRLAFAFQPDVLLLDLAMPGMSGYDVARRLRELVRFEDTLLVAITGYADDRHRLMAQASGFDQYLAKPAEPSAVEGLLRLERDRLAALRKRPGQLSRKSPIHLAEAVME